MSVRVNLPKSESYSVALAEKLTSEFFSNNLTISGSQIVRFCKIDQVNFFVLKVLMDKWKEETTKLRSPYFDYENEEVKNGVEVFLNILSNHILIKKEFFRPLLQKAIYEAIIYIINPKEYIKTELIQSGQNIEGLKKNLKFYKVHKRFSESIINKVKPDTQENEFNEMASLYSEHSDYFDSIQPILEQFSSLLVINPKEFILEEQIASLKVEERKEESSIKKSIDIPTVVETASSPTKENTTLNQTYSKSQLTLNDMLKQQNVSNSGMHVKSKIFDIKSAIPLNQKFIFISELFSGHSGEYEAALAEINNCTELEEAKQLLKDKYLPKWKWDLNRKTVQDFFEIVSRKFY
ncbi:hypothetical protein CHU_3303 [Sporocytophaga myxococcoides]|uniref:Uncharacterized protein n=1 Tax=Sporocytophaga myxococcoides TaxID=153721 RepID=A0A098LKR0_9BACT|nr:hypothetical protein [Sporocytophaga myxococcoides]GAL87576.1 hypothetical protein CHU_3303 [Sporocytophaga myxococcoides]